MQIALWDVNPEVFFAWTQVFGELENVRFGSGNILKAPVDAVVSPGNSLGQMSGGVDLS